MRTIEEAEMKKASVFTFIAVLVIGMCFGCSKNDTKGSDTKTEETVNSGTEKDMTTKTDDNSVKNNPDAGVNSVDNTQTNTTIPEDNKQEDTTIPEDGSKPIKDGLTVDTDSPEKISEKDSVFTITGEGEFIFSGRSDEARIVVDAEDAEVTITLNGVDITSGEDSVIYVEDAAEVTIKAQNSTVNTLTDARPERSSDSDETGAACIYSKDDLKLQGKGTLIVIGNYNNGIHSKNDIKIKNLKLEVTAANNAIKGNDSITVESGTIKLVAKDGDGLKTKNNDVSAKGKQRGLIKIEGGVLDIYADSDCIKAAYDVVIAPEAEVNEFEY